MTARNVTAHPRGWTDVQTPDPTPIEPESEGRYRIYRLCTCEDCQGTGKTQDGPDFGRVGRCKSCRGEGRSLELVAAATDPESVGVALVTLAREHEFAECPIGLMDRPEGQTGTWLIKPWLPSPRNVSDAGRLLRAQHP